MPVFNYENLTHAELAGLPRDKTAILISAGPLEQHSLHLPLGTDAMTAVYFSRRLAEKLGQKRPDWNFVILPALFAGSDTLTYMGTIEVRPAILRGLLYDCCRQFCKDGFRNIIGVSTHGGPRHNVVLEEIASKMRWRFRARMVVASARLMSDVLGGRVVQKITAQMEKKGTPLSVEEREGLRRDYHGGFLETSLMLVAHPDLVRPNYKTLKPALIESARKIRRSSGKKVGEGLGHLGSPALARKDVGEAAIEVFFDEVVPPLDRFLGGEDLSKHFRSKFYYIPFFRTDFKMVMYVIVYIIVFAILLAMMNRFLLDIYK